MLVSNTDTVPDEEVAEVLGIARGNTVQARSAGHDFTQGILNLLGGELAAYSGLLASARDEAVDRMVADAEEMGAEAVVDVRLETSSITRGSSEVLAYGTAVRFE